MVAARRSSPLDRWQARATLRGRVVGRPLPHLSSVSVTMTHSVPSASVDPVEVSEAERT